MDRRFHLTLNSHSIGDEEGCAAQPGNLDLPSKTWRAAFCRAEAEISISKSDMAAEASTVCTKPAATVSAVTPSGWSPKYHLRPLTVAYVRSERLLYSAHGCWGGVVFGWVGRGER